MIEKRFLYIIKRIEINQYFLTLIHQKIIGSNKLNRLLDFIYYYIKKNQKFFFNILFEQLD